MSSSSESHGAHDLNTALDLARKGVSAPPADQQDHSSTTDLIDMDAALFPFKPAGSTAEDKLAEAKRLLELIAFDGKADREAITANAVQYLKDGGKYPNHSTLAAAFLASLDPAPTAQQASALTGKTKPADVTHEAWYTVGEILFAVSNKHHAWGSLDQLPQGWTDELHEQLARALMASKAAGNRETLRPSAPRLAEGWQQLLSAHVHKLELACMVEGGSVTWNQEGCRAMASLLRVIGDKLDIALERELAGDLDPPLISEAFVEAVVKCVVDLVEERARYFDGSRGHFDRTDAARSYRASAKEIATALRRAMVSNAGQLQLELNSGEAAIDWISSNCPALRKDSGELLYRLPQMVKAFQAGAAQASQNGEGQ